MEPNESPQNIVWLRFRLFGDPKNFHRKHSFEENLTNRNGCAIINEHLRKTLPNDAFFLKKRGVAQLGRALGSGPRGRKFESCHSDQKTEGVLCPRGFLVGTVGVYTCAPECTNHFGSKGSESGTRRGLVPDDGKAEKHGFRNDEPARRARSP